MTDPTSDTADRCECGAMSTIECGEMPGRHCGMWERQPHSTTEALAQTIRLAYYTELCRKPPNSFVMRDWSLLVTIERAPWIAAARAAEAEFNVR